MKSRIFATTLLISLLLALGATAAVFFEARSARTQLGLGVLEDGLYAANAELVRWAVSGPDATRLTSLTLPESIAEIVMLEPASLRITAATVPGHVGRLLPQVPGLLDRAEPLMQALASGKPAVVKARDYTLITRPAAGGLWLVAFKPRAAEAALLHDQQAAIDAHFRHLDRIMLATAAAGLLLAIILALVITRLAAGSHTQALKAFDALSRGNFESVPAGLKPDEARIYARLHTSLSLALERLGRK